MCISKQSLGKVATRNNDEYCELVLTMIGNLILLLIDVVEEFIM